ncbi:MAG: hypothetical protein ACK5IJ_06570 [Mangrovibacterium sp.]
MNKSLLRKKYIIALLASLLTCVFPHAKAQESTDSTPFFLLSGKISVQSGSSEGVLMSLSQGNKTIQKITLNKSGKYEFELDYNKHLHLTIQKEGYFPKIINIDTSLPRHILQGNNDFPPLSVNLQMIKQTSLITYNYFSLPLADISYSSSIDNIDINYSQSDEELKQLIAEAEVEQKLLAAEQSIANQKNDQSSPSNEEKYQQILTEGNLSYNTASYNDALKKYQEAHALIPEESFALDRIGEIEMIMQMLAEQAAIDANYNAAIAQADKNFKAKQYTTAITDYHQALNIKPNDEYAQKQITESQLHLSNHEILAQYTALISIADKALQEKDFSIARENYSKAKDLKVEKEYPEKRLAEIDALEAEQNRLISLENQYLAAMKDGNLLFSNEHYENAITLFEKALEFKSNDAEARKRIADSKKAIVLRNEHANYASVITAADSAFQIKDYELARQQYKKALTMMPSEEYPKQQNSKIDQLLIAQEKEKIKAHYDSIIAIADAAFQAKDYTLARQQYKQSLTIITSEEYPKQQNSKIDQLLIAQEEAKIKAKYDSIIAIADAAFQAKDYTLARQQYKQSLAIMASEEYPKQQNSKIDQLLIAQEKEKIKAKYDSIITIADAAFQAKDYTLARQQYKQSLAIMASEEYPKQQNSKIDQLLIAQEKEKIKAKYDSIIAIADENFRSQTFSLAENNYNEAIRLLPSESYAQEQLKKIAETRLAVKEAQRAAYKEEIAEGDNNFHQQSYALAKYHYNEAIKLISWEEYPKAQIRRITELSRAPLSEADKQKHAELVSSAHDSYNKKDLAVARTFYLQALQINQSDDQSALRLMEIEKQIKETDVAKQSAAYNELLKKADNAFEEKQFSVARSYYNQVLNLNANDEYAKAQLKKIADIVNNN